LAQGSTIWVETQSALLDRGGRRRCDSEEAMVQLRANPLHSPQVQQLCVLLCIVAVGRILQKRFPSADASAIQKFLLQVCVPALLFKGLSSEAVSLSHLAYICGGVVVVLVRLGCSTLVSLAVMGRSSSGEQAKLRRTAQFEMSTCALGLSVLPYLSEFVSVELVGKAGMVDLPMKLYFLIVVPVLVRKFGEGSPTSSTAASSGGAAMSIVSQLANDPISIALVLGIVTAALTEGGGTPALGFVGKAVDVLASLQTPILFFLIGAKLKLEGNTPLFSFMLLLANQGVLLILVQVVVLVSSPEDDMKQFITFLVQGAPSIITMGVIKAATDSGVQGYAPDFAFDLVGMGFPMLALLQVSAGVVGPAYSDVAGLIGLVLIAIAASLRCVYRGRFSPAPPEINEVPLTGV